MGVSLVGGLSLHPATSYPPPNPRQLPHPSHSLPPLHHHLPLALALSSDSYFSLSSSPNSSGLSSPTSHLPNPSSLVHTRSAFLFPHTSSSSSSLHRPQDVRMEPQSVVVSDQSVLDSLVTVRSARNGRMGRNNNRHSFSEGDDSNPNFLSLPSNHTHSHTHSGPTRTRRNSSGSETRVRRLSHGNQSLSPSSDSLSLRRQRRRSHDARDGQMDLLESLVGNFRVRRQSRNGASQSQFLRPSGESYLASV